MEQALEGLGRLALDAGSCSWTCWVTLPLPQGLSAHDDVSRSRRREGVKRKGVKPVFSLVTCAPREARAGVSGHVRSRSSNAQQPLPPRVRSAARMVILCSRPTKAGGDSGTAPELCGADGAAGTPCAVTAGTFSGRRPHAGPRFVLVSEFDEWALYSCRSRQTRPARRAPAPAAAARAAAGAEETLHGGAARRARVRTPRIPG